jgi:hypothetical protein
MKAERFISGIFNYCDYWCERCAFTQRCRNFVMGRELDRKRRGERVDDASQQVFWDGLADRLREATVFAHAGDWADPGEADLDDTPDPIAEGRRQAREDAVEKHPLVTMADAYMMKVHAWLPSAEGDLKAFAQGLLESAGKPFAGDDYEEQARQIGEMLEVITWYHTLLPPKIARAVGGQTESESREDEDGEFAAILAESSREDANGSGKVALVGIERSAAAWVRMRDILPRREDEVLEMLSMLSRLRRGIHEAVPGAESFVRPGFDEEPEKR